MKIVFVSRATLFSNPGGDTIQLTQTAKHLKWLGVEVHVKLTNEVFEYDEYDLIHFFNIIRPADVLYHTNRTDKPYVVSTIFVDYSEFERKNTRGIRKIVCQVLSPDLGEYFKVLARSVWNKESIRSNYYLFRGHRASVKKVISNAAMLLPNSESEYGRLKERYCIEARYRVIPNGIDKSLFGSSPTTRHKSNRVLCVARVEPLKNQLNLIKALSNTDFQLLLIGKASANHQRYFEECKSAAGNNIEFIDYIPQRELVKFYNEAKVHVLPSWFETTGLSSLEAAALGCNIVITDKGDTREYFGNFAYYCDPTSPASILNAIILASKQPGNPDFANYVIKHYTWEIAATKSLDAYNHALSNR
jgi:glycosyltransferase involved in cell wall biosynthesis